MSHHSRSGRAWRRHDRARVKALRASHQRFVWIHQPDMDPQFRAIFLGRLVHTASRCACGFCQNPRRFFQEITLAERKANARLREELKDCLGSQDGWGVAAIAPPCLLPTLKA